MLEGRTHTREIDLLHQRQRFEKRCTITEIADGRYRPGELESREEVEESIDLLSLSDVCHD